MEGHKEEDEKVNKAKNQGKGVKLKHEYNASKKKKENSKKA